MVRSGGEDVPLVPAPAKPAPAGRCAGAQPAGRSPPRLRTGAAARQQERARTPSSSNIPTASMPASPSCSSTRSPPRKPASPPPRRRGWPSRSGHGSPPKARRRSEQAKAEADARAAEQARIAAEKAKQVAQDQAAAAEQKRLAAEKAAAGPRLPPSRRRSRKAPISRRCPRIAAGRRHQIGAGRTAPRRLPDRRCRWRLERGFAALADAVQPLRRDQARRQGWPASTRSMRSS